MKTKKLLVSLIAVLTVCFLATFVSALSVTIDQVELNGVSVNQGDVVASFAGELLPIRVQFTALAEEEDVTVSAWLSGYKKDILDVSNEYHLLSGSQYTSHLSLRMPENIDLSDTHTLYVRIEGDDDYEEARYTVRIQRDSYDAEFLEVQCSNTAKVGDVLPVTVVVQNTGYEDLEDVFVEVRLLDTNSVKRAYLSDLPPIDDNDDDEDNTVERTINLDVPNVASGTYTLEIEVSNGDFRTLTQKSIVISGVEKLTKVVPSQTNQKAKVGEEVEWTVTLINLANEPKVYEFIPELNADLSIETDPTMLVVGGKDSKTLIVRATAEEEGVYNFVVRVVSDGKIVNRIVLSSKVEGTFFDVETTIAVVLAIIFAVLLVVLIVLLTRKPKKEEFEESYY
jgi:hypothetical protein